MRIIACEMKKIWNIKIIGIIVVISALFYLLFMHHYIRWYPEKGTWESFVEFAHHLTENYGTKLSPSDFEDFLNLREGIVSEMDLFISSNPVFVAAGIHDFLSYEIFLEDSNYRYETLSEAERNLRYALRLELGYIIRSEFINEDEYTTLTSENETPLAYMQIRRFDMLVSMYQMNILGESERESMIDSFMRHFSTMENFTVNERDLQRLIEIRDSGEMLNIMEQLTMDYTWRYGRSLAVLAILATLILVSPLIATDRANRINWLQYSSKQGRGILKKQFFAILLSAVMLTTVLVIIFGGIFSTLETWRFWNNGINSFMSYPYHWLSITYGQYVLLMVGVIYLFSIGTAIFAFTLSRFSQNMVRLMFKVIPSFVAAQRLSNWVLFNFLGIFVGGDVFAQMFWTLLALVAVTVIAMGVLHREKKCELM